MQLPSGMSPGKKGSSTVAAPRGRCSKELDDNLRSDMALYARPGAKVSEVDPWTERDNTNPALGSSVSEISTSPGSTRTSVSTTASQGSPTPAQSTVSTQSTPSPKESARGLLWVAAAIRRQLPRLPGWRALSLPSIEKTFESDQWLTGASINFVYTQFSLDTRNIGLPGLEEGRIAVGKLPKSILLMDPAIAFRLTTGRDASKVSEERKKLELGDRRLVVCPVSDRGDGSNADGRTHWSLLVGWAVAAEDDFTFVHYDTMAAATESNLRRRGSSYQRAHELAARLAGRQEPAFSRGDCPVQANGNDSGMYVLLFSATVAGAALMEGKLPLAEGGKPVWERGLKLVTPEEVMARREQYREMAMEVATRRGQYHEMAMAGI